jgi:hypothetical protein
MNDLVTLVARRAVIIWIDAEIRVNRTESRRHQRTLDAHLDCRDRHEARCRSSQ